MIKNGIDFTGVNSIKNCVFYYMVGISKGSAPTYFMGDIIVQYGYVIGLLVNFVILGFLFYLSNIIYYKFSNNLFLC
jgi:large-conductance mechanosensitive channel